MELLRYTALVEFCLLISGLGRSMLGRLLAWTLWSRGAATPDTLVEAALARLSRIDLEERADTLEDDRCRRADVGMIVAPVPNCSLMKKWSEVEEVVDATEAVCARKADSSLVNLLTMFSCSFSSSRCKSAALTGRGCRMGPVHVSSAAIIMQLRL